MVAITRAPAIREETGEWEERKGKGKKRENKKGGGVGKTNQSPRLDSIMPFAE